jgi:AcrR family transcriptional regulator
MRQARHEEAQLAILEAAAEAIAERGYHGMSMRDLARATGRSLANLYNYFSSKEDLLFALQTSAFETLISSLHAALAEVKDPAARLYVFIYNQIRYLGEHRAIMRVLVHEAAALPPARRKIVRNLKERYFGIANDLVAAVLKQPLPAGQDIDDAEVERATYSIFGMLNWTYGWYDPALHGTPHDVARTMHKVAIGGLVGQCPYRPDQETLELHLASFSPPPLLSARRRKEV